MPSMPDSLLIDIYTLKNILRSRVDEETHEKILKDIQKTLEEEEQAQKEEKEETEEPAPPKVPKKLVVLVTGLPESISEKSISEIGGFICEIPEDEPASSIPEKLQEVASEYACTKKAKKNPANSTGELWEVAPAKLFKNYGLTKKSKGAVEFFAYTKTP